MTHMVTLLLEKMEKVQQIILVSKKIDLYISSLSKGLGSFGGYIASKKCC